MLESTLVMVKPDGVRRGLIGEVIHRFEARGLVIRGIRSFVFTDELLQANYGHVADRPFFPELRSYLTSGMTVALWVSGVEAVQVVRRMIGDTNARTAAPGTIRGDFAISTQRNVVHASDSVDNAQVELARFFPDGPTVAEDESTVRTLYATTEA